MASRNDARAPNRPPLPPAPSIPLALYPALYLFSGVLLSYVPLPLTAKLWIGFFGLVLPGIVQFLAAPRIPSRPSRTRSDPWPNPSVFILTVFLGAGLFLRFRGLLSFQAWPLFDEGMYGFIALDLAKHWRWEPYLLFTQSPPLFFWMESLYFKGVPAGLFTLWLFPAILSSLTAVAACWSARQWLPRNAAWAAAGIWAICYWPAYLGRYATLEVFLLFWEVVALGWLGVWWKGGNKVGTGRAPLVLGLWTGVGFWISHHWPFVALWLACAAGALVLRSRENRRRDFLAFAVGVAVPLVAMALMVFNPDFGWYLRSLWGQNAGFGMGRQALEGLRYVAAVFWGTPPSEFGYRPFWGGYLNPVLGAFAWMGILRALRRRDLPSTFLLAGIALGLATGFLSRLTEYFRITHAIPFFLWAVWEGLDEWLDVLPVRRRRLGLTLLVLLSVGLDLTHMELSRDPAARPGAHWTNASRSQAQALAYRELEDCRAKWGPGAVLVQVSPEVYDQSLGVALHGWNTAHLPEQAGKPPRWWAVYLERGFADALKDREPTGRVVPLPEDFHPDQPLALFIRPPGVGGPDAPPDETAIRWINVDQAYEAVVRETIAHKEGPGRFRILKEIRGAEPSCRGDRVLEALDALRQAQYFHTQAVAGYYHPEILGPGDPVSLRVELLREEVGALERSVRALDVEPAQGYLREARQVLDQLGGKTKE